MVPALSSSKWTILKKLYEYEYNIHNMIPYLKFIKQDYWFVHYKMYKTDLTNLVGYFWYKIPKSQLFVWDKIVFIVQYKVLKTFTY